MNLPSVGIFFVVFLASYVATSCLARAAPRLGWTDAPRGDEAGRKAQKRPVPAVGGVAIVLAVALGPVPWVETGLELWVETGLELWVETGLELWVETGLELWGRWLPARGWIAASFLCVLFVGLWDDRRSLGPGHKVAAQIAALAPLACGAWLESGPFAAFVPIFVGLVALNVLNTFDNADGALAGLCALGFAGIAPHLSAACLGFLPLNLDAARLRNRASGAPSAYLGDSGAFVLAYAVLLTPLAAGILVLPAIDLARLAVERWRAGSRPWIGDRRHLAHRLQDRGIPRPLVALLLCGLAWPALALVERAIASQDGRPAVVGVLISLGLVFLVLRWAPLGPDGASCAALPCPPEGGSE